LNGEQRSHFSTLSVQLLSFIFHRSTFKSIDALEKWPPSSRLCEKINQIGAAGQIRFPRFEFGRKAVDSQLI